MKKYLVDGPEAEAFWKRGEDFVKSLVKKYEMPKTYINGKRKK